MDLIINRGWSCSKHLIFFYILLFLIEPQSFCVSNHRHTFPRCCHMLTSLRPRDSHGRLNWWSMPQPGPQLRGCLPKCINAHVVILQSPINSLDYNLLGFREPFCSFLWSLLSKKSLCLLCVFGHSEACPLSQRMHWHHSSCQPHWTLTVNLCTLGTSHSIRFFPFKDLLKTKKCSCPWLYEMHLP